MSERWLPVIGFPGYEVSDLGRVRSWKVHHGTPGPRLLTACPNPWGYLQVSLYRGGQCRTRSVHVLVLEAFVGPRPASTETRHLNGNKLDNRLANLTYGSRSENTRDQVRHGTHHHSRKTHCPHDHEYTPENTYWANDGRSGGPTRHCRACDAARARRRRAAGRRSTVLQT